uniref:Uncharacterized protein n=1 Tax=Anguilla anguilla TaxID=7936 RepID=A0A0E9WQM5_ANGAN
MNKWHRVFTSYCTDHSTITFLPSYFTNCILVLRVNNRGRCLLDFSFNIRIKIHDSKHAHMIECPNGSKGDCK